MDGASPESLGSPGGAAPAACAWHQPCPAGAARLQAGICFAACLFWRLQCQAPLSRGTAQTEPCRSGSSEAGPGREGAWAEARDSSQRLISSGEAAQPLSLPAPEWHLLMIKVPVVYNYQFDKFMSSLLIIIISSHSVRMQEFNNNINNGRTIMEN